MVDCCTSPSSSDSARDGGTSSGPTDMAWFCYFGVYSPLLPPPPRIVHLLRGKLLARKPQVAVAAGALPIGAVGATTIARRLSLGGRAIVRPPRLATMRMNPPTCSFLGKETHRGTTLHAKLWQISIFWKEGHNR